MFVSCDNCQAEYELDDAKIPSGGARLRCTSCDHAFVIIPPEPSDEQTAADLAREALSTEVSGATDPDSERVAAPEDDFDPGAESEFNLEGEIDFDAAGDVDLDLHAASDQGPGAEVGSDLDAASELDPGAETEIDSEVESDWEFNDEIETAEPEVDEPAELGQIDTDGDAWSSLSTAEDAVDGLLGSSGPIDTDAAAAVDDLLGEIETADPQPEESVDVSTVEPESSGEGAALGEPDAPDKAVGEPAAVGEPSAADDASFEDLSNWDLFDQPTEADASTVSAGATSQQASAAQREARAEPQVDLAVAMADDSPTAVRWSERVLGIAGWGAVLSMLIAALVGGLAWNSSEARAPAGSWSGAGLEADQIVGRWVDNAVAGSIYVISGRIRVAPGSDRSARQGVGIRLFDAAGQEIDRAPIPLAPEIPERILRESDPDELDAFQAGRADRIAAVGTGWMSFEAVLTDLPRTAGRFELQALDR